MKFTSFAFLLLSISLFCTAYTSSTTGDVSDVMKTPYYQKMLRSALQEINKMNSQDVILLIDGVTNVNSITVKIESGSLVQVVHFDLDVTDERGRIYNVELDVYAQPLRNTQRVDDYSMKRKHRYTNKGNYGDKGHSSGGNFRHNRRNSQWI